MEKEVCKKKKEESKARADKFSNGFRPKWVNNNKKETI